MRFVDRVEEALSTSVANAYRACLGMPRRTIDELEDACGAYVERLRARDIEFLDLGTALRVASTCRALLERLRHGADPARQAAVQAAVEYFVLENDGENDDSIVGFDDDLRVVQLTADVLGWSVAPDEA